MLNLARTEDEATWVCTAGVVLKSQEHRTMLRRVAEDSWAIEEAALDCEGKRWHQETLQLRPNHPDLGRRPWKTPKGFPSASASS